MDSVYRHLESGNRRYHPEIHLRCRHISQNISRSLSGHGLAGIDRSQTDVAVILAGECSGFCPAALPTPLE